MKWLKLREMQVTRDKLARFKGHCLINLETVRKISKYRHEGESVTRLSFHGLPSRDDIWVQETPQDMAQVFLRGGQPHIAEKDFDPIQIKAREEKKPEELPAGDGATQTQAPAPDVEFESMYEEIAK